MRKFTKTADSRPEPARDCLADLAVPAPLESALLTSSPNSDCRPVRVSLRGILPRSHPLSCATPCKSTIMSIKRIPPELSGRIMSKNAAAQILQADGTANRSEIERIVRQVLLARIGGQARPDPPALRVDASARHLHLSRQDLETLFGPGYELKVHHPLYQEGNFAAQETVTIIGPRSRLISNLRILGPLRKKTQVELAFTDAIGLGFDNLPIRLSGDTAGTPGALLMGPRGYLELAEGVIRAAIHVHMNPAEAAYFGVKQGDAMKLRVGGAAATTFDRVLVRIDPASRLNVHMDTDEANACGLHLAKDIELVK